MTKQQTVVSGTDVELYDYYVWYMESARRLMLPLMPTKVCRDWFLKTHRIMSREKFTMWLSSLEGEPERRRELQTTLRAGFSEELTTAETQMWQNRLAAVL